MHTIHKVLPEDFRDVLDSEARDSVFVLFPVIQDSKVKVVAMQATRIQGNVTSGFEISNEMPGQKISYRPWHSVFYVVNENGDVDGEDFLTLDEVLDDNGGVTGSIVNASPVQSK